MSLPRAIRVNSEFTSGPMPRKDNELEPAHSTAIRIGPPQHCRTISVVAIRWGKPPALPPPHETFVDAEQNVHTLIDADVIPMAPELNGNHDNRKFQANATYVYALSHPPKSYLSGVPEYERGDINTGALIDFIYDQDELFGGRAVEYRESRV